MGLRPMLMSDGPSGVRGEHLDERDPSLNLSSASVLAATWDVAFAERYGAVLAAQARLKGVHVVLGPTINLHRSPLGGRHFECFSEDPLLSGALAAGFVRGVQRCGVAAVPKHYVANDAETDRYTADVRADERTLREVYLAPFEMAVRDGGAWAVMSAYNAVNGTTMSENDLLRSPLSDEWGFAGPVVSDWTAVHSTEASALAGQDLVMPGPDGPWGAALVEAVRAGRVPEAIIDDKVRRLLWLAAKVGALGQEAASPATSPPEGFARETAAAGMVLARNRGELPWPSEGPRSIAVIGQAAEVARTQGGGSARVMPPAIVPPLHGLREALPETEIRYERGAVITDGPLPLPLHTLTNPVTAEPGVRARFLDVDGNEVFAEDRRATDLLWFGGGPGEPADRPGAVGRGRPVTLELSTWYRPETTGLTHLGVASVGRSTVFVDGAVVLEADLTGGDTIMGSGLFAPPSASAPVRLTADRPVLLRVEHDLTSRIGGRTSSVSLSFGIDVRADDEDAEIDRAVDAARAAEAAVVVVGTTASVESEGVDRTSLALPGRQDELVRAVAAANPRTVVVVNAGAPVLMPWRDEVAAILLAGFPGQDFGHALADVLLGVAEPGGRLPTTWPAAEADVPVLSTRPVDGVLDYAEGVHVGHRGWLRAGREPAYPFGHGLGYTTWCFDELMVPESIGAGEPLPVTVRVTNTGARAGKQVVQVYLSRPETEIDRPVRWLAGFAVVRAGAGETVEANVEVGARALAHWDGGWRYEPGAFLVHAGASSVDLPLTGKVETG
ncbi:beta-glucosidase family protein [Actinomadura madurae]|uniref:beta-glucosidase family protein n=2 Tax=Actinomadura madurae TaxID=1993 RepID=UPI0020D1F695|nr:glycoside hydrolase family 3 C-terminal domain-containing protein [Actinomadura madurae]MCQ0015389.1 glycoside hydrolase family 3 C-terminal domain-containing protein [Actinomadura madurae]